MRDGWECDNGSKCINGFDKDGLFCDTKCAYGYNKYAEACVEDTEDHDHDVSEKDDDVSEKDVSEKDDESQQDQSTSGGGTTHNYNHNHEYNHNHNNTHNYNHTQHIHVHVHDGKVSVHEGVDENDTGKPDFGNDNSTSADSDPAADDDDSSLDDYTENNLADDMIDASLDGLKDSLLEFEQFIIKFTEGFELFEDDGAAGSMISATTTAAILLFTVATQ